MTFEEAYKLHYPAVVRSAWLICRDNHRAEELAQEAFARAYPRWRKLDRGGYAVAWLHRVVMNLSLTASERRRRGRQLERDHGFHPTDPTPREREVDQVIELLRDLPSRQREALFLRFVLDLDVAHVAAGMRCTPGTVKTHTKRGLDRLRDDLAQEGGHHGPRSSPSFARR